MKGTLSGFLDAYNRIGIAGGPLTGKTTFANEIADRPVLHTDDAIPTVSWADQPKHWIDKTEDLGSFLLEGVQVARCLRKGLAIDAVVRMEEAKAPLTPGQATMAKGERTIFEEWRAANEDVPIFYW